MQPTRDCEAKLILFFIISAKTLLNYTKITIFATSIDKELTHNGSVHKTAD